MPRGQDYNVRELRERLGISQEEMEKRVGVSMMTISRWERGQVKPSRLAVEKLEGLARRAKQKGKAAA